MSMFDSATRCMTMLHMIYKLTKVYTNNTWHEYVRESSSCLLNVNTSQLLFVCLVISSLCKLKRKTIVSSIPICYAKCFDVNIFHLNNYLCWRIILFWQLACMTLWDLYACSLGPSQVVNGTLTTINIVVYLMGFQFQYRCEVDLE